MALTPFAHGDAFHLPLREESVGGGSPQAKETSYVLRSDPLRSIGFQLTLFGGSGIGVWFILHRKQ
jgi:hypothetical protein